MKKIKISGFDEEILANFGFAPEALNEMYDVLDQTKKVIEDYLSNAPRFPTALRKKIAELDTEADLLFLEFNELYMMTSELIENYKKIKLRKKTEIEERKVNEILKRKKLLRKRIMKLINETTKFIEELKTQNKKLPIA